MNLMIQKQQYEYQEEKAWDIIRALCSLYDIQIRVPKYKHATGRAFLDDRAISIPLYLTKYGFIVAIHEINHILLNDKKTVDCFKGTFELEYTVEKMTIKHVRNYKFIDKYTLESYITGAKEYIRDLINTRNIHLVKKEIINWINK